MVLIRGVDFPGVRIKRPKNGKPRVFLYGRNVGFIRGSDFFKPAVDRDRHVYHKWNSVGIEKRILNAVELLGVKRVCFRFKDEEGWYKVPLTAWMAAGRELNAYAGMSQLHLTMEQIDRFCKTQVYKDREKRAPADFKPAEELVREAVREQKTTLAGFIEGGEE